MIFFNFPLCHLQKGPLRSRILGISPLRTATVSFALPLAEFLEGDAAPPPFWNSELFVRPAGSGRSWSGGVGYDVSGGKFKVEHTHAGISIGNAPFWNPELPVRPVRSGRSWNGGVGYDAGAGRVQVGF